MSGTPALGPRVLLVEDNRDDALLIRRAFRKAGLAPPAHVEDGRRPWRTWPTLGPTGTGLPVRCRG